MSWNITFILFQSILRKFNLTNWQKNTLLIVIFYSGHIIKSISFLLLELEYITSNLGSHFLYYNKLVLLIHSFVVKGWYGMSRVSWSVEETLRMNEHNQESKATNCNAQF